MARGSIRWAPHQHEAAHGWAAANGTTLAQLIRDALVLIITDPNAALTLCAGTETGRPGGKSVPIPRNATAHWDAAQQAVTTTWGSTVALGPLVRGVVLHRTSSPNTPPAEGRHSPRPTSSPD